MSGKDKFKEHIEQVSHGRKITRILLLYGPTIDYDNYDIAARKKSKDINYPPIGLAYLGGVLRQEISDIELKIVDLHHESIKKMFLTNQKRDVLETCTEEILRDFEPDLVGISVVFSSAIDNGLEIARITKEFNKDIIVALGGVHCTFEFESILKNNSVDVVFLHEADITFAKYIKCLNNESNDRSMYGIAFRNKKDEVVKIPYESYPDFESLPLPAWDLLEIPEYYKYSQMSGVKNIMDVDAPTGTIQTQRGCKASCAFCSVRNFNGKSIRARSPENAIKEIDVLYNKFGIRYIDFVDDDFTFDRDRAIDICNKIIKRNYNLVWTLDNGIRLVTLSEELIEKLLEAGCRLISVGIESGNKDILKRIRKPLTLKILYEKVELLHRYPELYVKANFIVGFPFESDEQIDDTFRVAREVALDQTAISIYNPLVGTDALSYSESSEKMDVEFRNISFGNSQFERFNNKEFVDRVYFENLRLNFTENPNYEGRNFRRALNDFLRILRENCPDHAVAKYCVSEIYKSLGDRKRHKLYLDQFNDVIRTSEKWRSYCERLGIPNGSSNVNERKELILGEGLSNKPL